MVYKYELSLKLYWRGFVNRKDWEPTSRHLYDVLDILKKNITKKLKTSTRYRLAINMKPVATIFDPKKVIRNKQYYLTSLYSSENTGKTFISRRSII